MRSFLSIRHAHGDLCKHLGIDSSTDHPDRYSNLFLNACINRHAHTGYSSQLLRTRHAHDPQKNVLLEL